MPNYRRLISYIYAYEGGIKGKNTGYAKIEVRGDQCRIQVNVKKVFVGSHDTGIYLLAPGKEILIGKLFVRGGNGEFRMNVSATDVESSGYGIDQCYGLTIHDLGSNWQNYTTIWEDAVAQAAEVQLEHVTAENIRRQEAERRAGEIPRTIEEIPEAQEPYPITAEIQRTLEQEEMRLLDIQPWEQEETTGNPASSPARSATPSVPSGLNGEPVRQQTDAVPGSGTLPEETLTTDTARLWESTTSPDAGRPSDMTILPHTSAPIGTTVSLGAGVPTDTTVSLDTGAQNAANKYIPESLEPQAPLQSPPASGLTPGESTAVSPESGLTSGESPVVPPESGLAPGESPVVPPESGLTSGESPVVPPESGLTPGESAAISPESGLTPGESPVIPPDSGLTPGESAAISPESGLTSGESPVIPPESGLTPGESAAISPDSRRTSGESVVLPTATGTIPGEPAAIPPATGNVPSASAAVPPASANVPASSSSQGPMAATITSPRIRRKNEDLWAEIEDEEVLRLLDQKEQEAKANMSPGSLWSRLQRNYSKVLAFEYDHGCEILSIRPQDIGLLPREIWVYGNNSFLLHGYYNYRHLILARLNTPKGRPRYLLGVPGHYYSNEKYMASMFGFPHFVLAKKQPDEDGRFGYWYTDIRL